MVEKKERPKELAGTTYSIESGCGPIYVTLNCDGDGLFEAFVTFGKGGGCSSTIGESIGRMMSLSFRCGISAEEIIKQLTGLTCHQQRPAIGDNPQVKSCVDAVATLLRQHVQGGCK